MTVDMPSGHVLVVGASLAGLRACEAARRLGFSGRLTLLGAEPHLPYDRPPLSKEFLDPGASRRSHHNFRALATWSTRST